MGFKQESPALLASEFAIIPKRNFQIAKLKNRLSHPIAFRSCLSWITSALLLRTLRVIMRMTNALTAYVQEIVSYQTESRMDP